MYHLKIVQNLPISLEEAWAFFSSPKNLAIITPPNLDFIIKSDLPENMYQGMFIQYTVKPLLGIPVNWVTEITHIRPGEYFVDEQRSGPYSIWHHEHFFKEIPGGVEMTDFIQYQLPFGILGKMMHPAIVRPRLEEIFSFRKEKMIELFGPMKRSPHPV